MASSGIHRIDPHPMIPSLHSATSVKSHMNLKCSMVSINRENRLTDGGWEEPGIDSIVVHSTVLPQLPRYAHEKALGLI